MKKFAKRVGGELLAIAGMVLLIALIDAVSRLIAQGN